MHFKRIKVALGLAFITLFAHPLFGQFYNGLNMNFGKNRVQYYDFYWQYYRFERFDTYFNEYGRDLALYVEWYANKEMKRLEAMLDYKLDRRIIFLVYNKLTDFRQSNLGLITGLDDYNTGGTTKIINNKVSLYYEGDHKKFNKQISAAIAEILLNEMLYGNELRENMANSTLLSLPSWFSTGLLSYLGENWSVEIEDHVKDGILSGRFKKYNRLTGDEATYAGHSFWKYIEKNYGKTVIPNIIYITRVNKNLKSSFLYVLGTSLRKLSKDWYAYYSDKYLPYSSDANFGNVIEKKPKKNRIYLKIKISPSSDYISYVTNDLGQYRLWLYNNSTGKKKCLLKREHKIDQIPDYTFPVLAWHPGGRILTFITEEKGGLKLWFYNIEDKTLNSRNLLYFEKVLDFSYSPDGTRFVLSAVKEGKTDIYVHTLASATDEQITNDLADDLTPRFYDNGRKIVFSSNRLTDSISSKTESKELSTFLQLYTISYPSKNKNLTLISNDKYSNHMQPEEVASNKFAYLGDNNGIINRYIAEYDSSISFVDTTIHYRYYTISTPVTNATRNIIEHDYNRKSNKIGQSLLKKNKYFLFQKELEPSDQKIKLTPSEFQKEYIKSIKKKEAADSAKKSLAKPLEPSELLALIKIDSTKTNTGANEDVIDINRYIFEIEKKSLATNQPLNAASDIPGKKDSTANEAVEKGPQIIIYQPAFYVNSLANQIDFTFLSTSYQPFNGSNSFYNPGFNVNLKIGTNDLFEDYKIVGGMRLGVDFDSFEYLLSVENLKYRLDKQLVFHRQAFKNVMNESEDVSYYVKTVTNEGFFILRYPLNQVFSVRGTASIRHDRTAFLAYNQITLDKPNINNVWAGLKTELVFDNTRKIGVNLYNGTRWKIFGEAFKQVNRGKSDLFVLGADYRHYLVIHRNLILANRVAGSTSFGGSRLLYYLGGVDNWFNFSTTTPTFDNSIRIDNQEKYAFQATATNMRGFSQNVRNGNSFLLSNNEVRWPFITYFANYPVSSSFWSSLQLVGFFDVGSAWTGLNPFKGNNAYQFDETDGYNPVKMIVNSNRAPFVFGYGYGIRARLLGYFMRFDWAWGVENQVILPHVFYFSLNLDF